MTTNEILAQWLDKAKQSIIENYTNYGLKASGSFEKSLISEVTENGNSIKGMIIGAHYAFFMENGRRPTSPTGPYKAGRKLYEIIEDWITAKGITIKEGSTIKQAAYAIAQKIHREGIIVPNIYNKGSFISSVINTQSISVLQKSIGIEITKNIKSEILETFNEDIKNFNIETKLNREK